MAFIDPLLGAQITFLLGITNLITLFFVGLTCRLIKSPKFAFLNKMAFVQKLYPYHHVFWWLFFISVGLHAVFAIVFYGLPQG
jgi:hypothetical protein